MSNATPSGASVAKYMLGDRILDDILDQYRVDYRRHLEMLSNLASNMVERQPILYIRNIPFIEPTAGTSSAMSAASIARYRQIDEELQALTEPIRGGESAVELGAIATAQSVVRQLASRELAPPEIARLNNEAVVMLWALGETRYALTVTDGEVGYVVRRAKKTIRKQVGVKASDFDLLRAN